MQDVPDDEVPVRKGGIWRDNLVLILMTLACVWGRFALIPDSSSAKLRLLWFSNCVTVAVVLVEKAFAMRKAVASLLYAFSIAFVIGLSFIGCREDSETASTTTFEVGNCSFVERISHECAVYTSTTSSIFASNERLEMLNGTREELMDAWFHSGVQSELENIFDFSFRGVEALSSKYDCLGEFSQVMCRALFFQPCSEKCTPQELCSDFSCGNEALEVCLSEWSWLWNPSIVLVPVDLYDGLSVVESVSLLQMVFTEWVPACTNNQFDGNKNDTCLGPRSGYNPLQRDVCEHVVQFEVDLTLCHSNEVTLDLALTIGLTICSVLIFSVAKPSARASKVRPPQWNISLLICILSQVVITYIGYNMSVYAYGYAWELPFFLCLMFIQATQRAILVRVLGLRAVRESVFSRIVEECKPGGKLFYLRHSLVEFVEISTQVYDLHTSLVKELDYKWVIGFASILGVNLVAFPTLVLVGKDRYSVFFEILFDLVYVVLKYYSSFYDRTDLIYTGEMSAILIALFSIALLTMEFYDLVAKDQEKRKPGTSRFFNLGMSTRVLSSFKVAPGDRYKTDAKTEIKRKPKQPPKDRRLRRQIKMAFAALSGGLGLSLIIWFVVSGLRLEQECQVKYTECVWNGASPKLYFSEGIFSPVSCGTQHVESLQLSNCGLETLPEGLEEFSSTMTFDFRGNPLTSIPRWIPQMFQSHQPTFLLDALIPVTRIDWSGANITVLPLLILPHLANLTTIDLSGNQLEVFPEIIFEKLRQIEHVDLSRNKIVHLPRQFSSTTPTSLRFLNLSHNMLESLPVTMLELAFEPPREDFELSFGGNPVEKVVYTASSERFRFPADLYTLEQLQEFQLYGKNLPEENKIPAQALAPMTSVKGITCDSVLRGSLPSTISSLSSLSRLALYENSLTGTIPTELGKLSTLTEVRFLMNGLTGTLPTEIGNLGASMLALDVEEPLVGGTIPSEIGKLTTMDEFVLYSSGVGGALPSEIGKLASLVYFDVQETKLSGTLPEELFTLENLAYVLMSWNRFYGTLSSSISKLKNLVYFDAQFNFLSGTLPESLGELENLQIFAAPVNRLSGTIPSELFSLKSLRYLVVDRNRLSGTIPSEVGSAPSLQVLMAHLNLMNGTIPDVFDGVPSLEILALETNGGGGTIPKSLYSLPNLRKLSLNGCNLEGNISSSIESLSHLDFFRVGRNALTGTLPTSIGTLQNLQYFSVASNPGLSGTLPTEFGMLSKLTSLVASQCNLQGTLPTELGGMQSLLQLNLEENNFSGTLPSELGALQNLNALNVSGNSNLVGVIPEEILSLPELGQFDFSATNLTLTPASKSVQMVQMRPMTFVHEQINVTVLPGRRTTYYDLTSEH